MCLRECDSTSTNWTHLSGIALAKVCEKESRRELNELNNPSGFSIRYNLCDAIPRDGIQHERSSDHDRQENQSTHTVEYARLSLRLRTIEFTLSMHRQ